MTRIDIFTIAYDALVHERGENTFTGWNFYFLFSFNLPAAISYPVSFCQEINYKPKHCILVYSYGGNGTILGVCIDYVDDENKR